jgi:hypothetical protein
LRRIYKLTISFWLFFSPFETPRNKRTSPLKSLE